MRFELIDRVIERSPDKLVAVKNVTSAEEYLGDHFPTFPVLPGVMMLEAITQAAGWLLHHRTGFGKSMAVLKEARNVKYGTFVAPGQALRVEVDFAKQTDAGASFKASGFVGDSLAVQARVEIAYFNLADRQVHASSFGQIQADDHNTPALLVRPDGKYLAAYANHSTDRLTRTKISAFPGNATAWNDPARSPK